MNKYRCSCYCHNHACKSTYIKLNLVNAVAVAVVLEVRWVSAGVALAKEPGTGGATAVGTGGTGGIGGIGGIGGTDFAAT